MYQTNFCRKTYNRNPAPSCHQRMPEYLVIKGSKCFMAPSSPQKNLYANIFAFYRSFIKDYFRKLKTIAPYTKMFSLLFCNNFFRQLAKTPEITPWATIRVLRIRKSYNRDLLGPKSCNSTTPWLKLLLSRINSLSR